MSLRITLLTLAALPLLGLARVAPAEEPATADSVLGFQVKDIDGKPVDLSRYKGKVLLIVNTASQCGYTPQYEGLEQIYKTYKDKGFEILAFPSNDFGAQEPGSDKEIKAFCTDQYSVTFPLFSKIVVKGDGKHPLYQYLTQQTEKKYNGEIPWNFTKFLVNRDGEVVARFQPKDEPTSEKVTGAIEQSLNASK